MTYEPALDLPAVVAILCAAINMIICVWWYDQRRTRRAQMRRAFDNSVIDLLAHVHDLRPDLAFVSAEADPWAGYNVCLADADDKRRTHIFFEDGDGGWYQGAGDEDVTAIRRHLAQGGFVDQDFLALQTVSPSIPLCLDSWSIAVREATAQMSRECSDGFVISLA